MAVIIAKFLHLGCMVLTCSWNISCKKTYWTSQKLPRGYQNVAIPPARVCMCVWGGVCRYSGFPVVTIRTRSGNTRARSPPLLLVYKSCSAQSWSHSGWQIPLQCDFFCRQSRWAPPASWLRRTGVMSVFILNGTQKPQNCWVHCISHWVPTPLP